MKSRYLKIAIGLFLIIVIAFIFGINQYNKPHVNVRDSKVNYVFTPKKLVEEYLQNEMAATKKYADQILQIEGDSYSISTLKGNSVITFKDTTSESSIICHLQPEENNKILKLKKDQYITVKGICTGYLLDVVMVECVLVDYKI
ncbi:hypothetical protein Lupro_11670 [Lutibacter profundi]|uniref:tRNA_anti-like n=1 Tax=Lutibacter profundi TaxID=1622118 RepID=A0A0X8G8B4_9FLAO|nr:hypothetical protein [Lutibacter profundi]AMC11883.1 hypothetical protein Lupro_11670 [Lutibacter profundi]